MFLSNSLGGKITPGLEKGPLLIGGYSCETQDKLPIAKPTR